MTDPQYGGGWIAEQAKHDGRSGKPRRELIAQPTLDGTTHTVGYLLGIIRTARDRGIMLPHRSELATFLQRRERELREEWEASGGNVERIEIRQMLTTEQFLDALSTARGRAASIYKPWFPGSLAGLGSRRLVTYRVAVAVLTACSEVVPAITSAAGSGRKGHLLGPRAVTPP